MIAARDYLEHFEERLPGGPKNRSLKQPNDLFNLAGDRMSFRGEKFDVGPQSLETLKEFVAELHDAVVFDSLDILAASNPRLLVMRIRRAQRDLELPRLIRRVELDLASSRGKAVSGS